MQTPPRTDLRSLILGLSLGACVITLANSLYAAYRVERQTLIDNSLAANRAYSARVASSIDEFLQESQLRLQYSATQLSNHFDDQGLRTSEAERLQLQDRGFDAVAIADAAGRVMTAVPESLRVDERMLRSAGAEAALRERKPLVSNIYTSAAGDLTVFVSVPILSPSGQYLGFVGGSLPLQRDGALTELASKHFHLNDSQVYIVDMGRTLLFHPVKSRVGSMVGANRAVDSSLRGEDGSFRMVDSKGNDVSSGFAPIPSAHWGVVSQQRIDSVLAPLDKLMMRIVLATVPVAVVGFVILWGLAMLIARPLRQLAENTTASGLIEGADAIASVKAWYFEASNIKQALLRGIQSTRARFTGLELASQTDPLTGLLNRRAVDDALRELEDGRRQLAIISLDIDHFKKVNDSFGHDAGDVVLQRLAGLMRECSRDVDLPCRMGGEEFVLLLPDTDLDTATEVAERLRRVVQETELGSLGHITISLGVTTWPRAGLSMTDALKEADELMYAAKRQGRNRVVALAS